jgi:hypothetical protein
VRGDKQQNMNAFNIQIFSPNCSRDHSDVKQTFVKILESNNLIPVISRANKLGTHIPTQNLNDLKSLKKPFPD